MNEQEFIKWIKEYNPDASLNYDPRLYKKLDTQYYSTVLWKHKSDSTKATTDQFKNDFNINLRKLVLYYKTKKNQPSMVNIMDTLFINFGGDIFVMLAYKLAVWGSPLFWEVYEWLTDLDKKELIRLVPAHTKSAMRIVG